MPTTPGGLPYPDPTDPPDVPGDMLALANALESAVDAMIVDGSVVGDDLVLERDDGSSVNAGNVRGPAGAVGPSASGYTNVKDAPYNATGDGVTDDTAAIHAACTAAGVGGKVIVPAGTYVVSGLVLDVDSQEWELAPGATIKLKNNSTLYAVGLEGANMTFRGGKVDGNRTNQTGFVGGIYLFNSNITVSDVEVTACREHGIDVEDPAESCLVTNCYVHDNGHTGNGVGGIFVLNSPHNRIVGNTCHDNGDYDTGVGTYDGDGIKIQGGASEQCVVANNVSYHNARRGIKVQDTLCIVTGNQATDNGGAGIGIVGGSGTTNASGTISGNVLSGNYFGIQIDNAGDWTISGNLVSDSRDHGCSISADTARLTVTGNTFTRSQKHGLLATGLKDSHFGGNTFLDNGQGASSRFGIQFNDDGTTGACARISLVGNRSGNTASGTTQTHGFVLSGTSDTFHMSGNSVGPGLSTTFSIAGTVTNLTRYANGTSSNGGWSTFLMDEGANIDAGATTGTKIGTTSSKKLGFWGATPVVRPTGTPAAATDAATTQALVNDIRTKLISMGLIS